MKNSFFSRFTPKEPKFFPLLKQLSEVLSTSSAVLVESTSDNCFSNGKDELLLFYGI